MYCKFRLDSHIIEYAEHIFVWFDEVGIPSGAAPTFDEAKRQLDNYAKSLDKFSYFDV
jgi:hypothetical protein